jgi:hypothetical protein
MLYLVLIINEADRVVCPVGMVDGVDMIEVNAKAADLLFEKGGTLPIGNVYLVPSDGETMAWRDTRHHVPSTKRGTLRGLLGKPRSIKSNAR